jgi:hypothetical protein
MVPGVRRAQLLVFEMGKRTQASGHLSHLARRASSVISRPKLRVNHLK